MKKPMLTPGSFSAATVRGLRSFCTKHWRHLLWVLSLLLLWQAFTKISWNSVWDLLKVIRPVEITLIFTINLLMLPLMSARWWLILKALGEPVGLLSASFYRLAANAISYLTPGPHFGGEPLAVYLLTHQDKTSLSSATTSVAIERLLEFIASFLVLTLCLISLTFFQNVPFHMGAALTCTVTFLILSAALLAMLCTGKRPLSTSLRLLSILCAKLCPSLVKRIEPGATLIAESEKKAEWFFRQHGYYFFLSNMVSFAHWGATFAEFWLLFYFLGFPLSLSQLIAVVVVARLAFFTPLPAGIGVLETAFPWVTAALGLGAGVGLSICLIIRFRDLIFTSAGLWFTLNYLTYKDKAITITGRLAVQKTPNVHQTTMSAHHRGG